MQHPDKTLANIYVKYMQHLDKTHLKLAYEKTDERFGIDVCNIGV
jgi:hypothetical protein